jgi:hypothetical protein
MSFFDWPLEFSSLTASAAYRRRQVALQTIRLFQRAFPKIEYQLLWESPVVNAQAWRLGERRYIYLYGGLVRHSKITRNGIALTLAHETGHHVGGEPYDKVMRWMSSEDTADVWAANIGMPLVFGPESQRLSIKGAREIRNLREEFERNPSYD